MISQVILIELQVKCVKQYVLQEYTYQIRGLKKLNKTAIITSTASVTSTYGYAEVVKDGVTYDTIRINSLNFLSKKGSVTKGEV